MMHSRHWQQELKKKALFIGGNSSFESEHDKKKTIKIHQRSHPQSCKKLLLLFIGQLKKIIIIIRVWDFTCGNI